MVAESRCARKGFAFRRVDRFGRMRTGDKRMSTGFATRKRATVTDLLKEPGKAELINGEIIRYMATGHLPSIVSGRIFRKLADFVDTIGKGFAYPDNVGFTVPELSS